MLDTDSGTAHTFAGGAWGTAEKNNIFTADLGRIFCFSCGWGLRGGRLSSGMRLHVTKGGRKGIGIIRHFRVQGFEPHHESEAKCKDFTMKISFHSYANNTNEKLCT